MYTVVVADDEEEIRRGIIKKVRWEELGFRVVGDAENGVEALELVEKLEPDLLLTDIRMPFMSGIELARQVREIRPTVQIAFLSGFDDFSYAQQAIQYNIISYMLKPISSQELEEELKNIKEIIDQKFEEFASKESVQDRLDKSEFMLPLLLEGYQGKVTEEVKEELRQNALSCGLLGSSDPEVYRYVGHGDQYFRSGKGSYDTCKRSGHRHDFEKICSFRQLLYARKSGIDFVCNRRRISEVSPYYCRRDCTECSQNYEDARNCGSQQKYRLSSRVQRMLPGGNGCIKLFKAERKQRAFYCG